MGDYPQPEARLGCQLLIRTLEPFWEQHPRVTEALRFPHKSGGSYLLGHSLLRLLRSG